MVLFLHILIALASLATAALAFLSPSKLKLRLTQFLVVLTLLSGTYLALSKPAHMAQVCLTGLLYLAIVSVGMVAAHYKLAGATALSE